jgi:adenylyl cyclase-associated protein
MAASTIDLPKINGAAPTPAPTGPLPLPPTRAVAEAPKPVVEALPESVEDFDAFLAGPLKRYVNLSDEVGGPVAEQVRNNGMVQVVLD